MIREVLHSKLFMKLQIIDLNLQFAELCVPIFNHFIGFIWIANATNSGYLARNPFLITEIKFKNYL